jgi:hypothetical protein
MALTATNVKVFVEGDRKVVVSDVLFDNSYPTGGEAFTGSMIGLDLEVNDLVPLAVTTAGAISPTKLVVFDHVNSKLVLYTAAGTEATNASDQSTVRVRVRAEGKGPAVV